MSTIGRGARKISERVTQEGRALISTERMTDRLKDFASLPNGALHIDPVTGAFSVKVEGQADWMPASLAGLTGENSILNIIKDAVIVYEYFTIKEIISATSFKYETKAGRTSIGSIDPTTKWMLFELDSEYQTEKNKLEVYINDDYIGTVVSGKVKEIDNTRFSVPNMPVGTTVLAKVIQNFNATTMYPRTTVDINPPTVAGKGDLWMKLDGNKLTLYVYNGTSWIEVHIKTTKAQVGLGNVEDYGLATQAEAEAGTSNIKYMTPLRTNQAIAKLVPTSTKAEAEAGIVDNKYMTPLRTKEAIDKNVPAASTSVVGKVQLNDAVNSTSLTQAATANAVKKVKDLVDSNKSDADAHKNNTSNPHSTTKAQVGLGSVENYGLATQAEAEVGASNAKYMTPLRTQQTVDIHKSDLVSHGIYGVATGVNTLVVPSSIVTSYPVGMLVAFKNTSANTGAATLNINGKGAKPIKRANGADVNPGNLKAGGIYQVRYDGSNFFLLGEGGEYGDVVAANVLSGKIFGTEEGLKTGTMPNNGAITSSINAGVIYTVPAGYHNGSGKVTGNSLASQTPGNIDASWIIKDGIAWVNGVKLTGTIPRKSAQTFTPSTVSQTITGGQYLDGIQTIAGSPNLIASNIKSGVNIFGVTGNITIESMGGIGSDWVRNVWLTKSGTGYSFWDDDGVEHTAASFGFTVDSGMGVYEGRTRIFNGTTWSDGVASSVNSRYSRGCGAVNDGLLVCNADSYSFFNGASWSVGSASINGQQTNALFGRSNAAMLAGMLSASRFNGSSWSAAPAASTNRGHSTATGLINAGILFGGNSYDAVNANNWIAANETFNGSAWATLSSTANLRRWTPSGIGNFDNAVFVGGYAGGASNGGGSHSVNCDRFNGSVFLIGANPAANHYGMCSHFGNGVASILSGGNHSYESGVGTTEMYVNG